MSDTSEELSNWKPGTRDDNEDGEAGCCPDDPDCGDCCCE
ncbi:hypothetical protein D3OALGA1CA_5870 [Olavius algarvensis associated proteobacterium Delta 3]|nr:hypothetical protein D3OALGB2SA_1303 [Olavius algarvensis associated proteobacterium Delta 3]CAB5172842.1 hypothetical protein D3OALGA1CA_5870 [Olavius algarvensis associated proteobacterium Delta 3]